MLDCPCSPLCGAWGCPYHRKTAQHLPLRLAQVDTHRAVVCRPAGTLFVRSQSGHFRIRQPPEPQHTRSLRQLGSSKPEEPLHFFRRSPRYALQLCHLTGYDIRIDARDRHHLTSHSGGPSSHFAVAMSFNRCSSNSILSASSGVSLFRYRSQAHVTTGRDQAQSRAGSAYSTAHLHRRPARSDPATTSGARESPTKSRIHPDANPPALA